MSLPGRKCVIKEKLEWSLSVDVVPLVEEFSILELGEYEILGQLNK